MSKFSLGADYDNAHYSRLELPDGVNQKIVNWSNSGTGILLFTGNPGLGKTYLCAAHINYLEEKRENFRFYSEQQFFTAMKEIIAKDWPVSFEINRICEVKHFIFDDLGSSSQMTDWKKECLFQMVDLRNSSRLPTIITSNLNLKDMEFTYGERFVSRLRDRRNTLIDLNWIDKRTGERA